MLRIVSLPESAWRVSRREFMRRLGGTTATGAFLAPALGGRAGKGTSPERDERFWEMVKEQFILREGLILMNAANLCPSPLSVMDTVFGYLRDEDQDASFQNRAKYDELRETSREKLARLLGTSPDEIALVRNTSEANKPEFPF